MAGVDQSIGEHDAMAGVDQSIGQHDMGHAAVQDVDNVPAADAGFTEVPGVGLSADYNADHTLGPSADHEYTHTVNHEYTHSAGHEYTPSTDFGFGHAGDLSLGNAGDVGIGHTGDGGLGHDGDGGIRDAGDGGIGDTGDDDVGHTGNHGVDNTAQDDVVHTENYGSDPAGDHGGNHSVEHPVDHATEHDTDHSIDQVPEDFQAQERQGHDGETVTGVGEKKWPGWPGESVFRMLVPAQKVGSIIGRKGEFIKKIVEETKARIKILDGPPGTTERAVLISAKEEPESSLPPAIDGLLTVHKRLIDGLEGESASTPPSTGPKVSTKILVPASQAGSLIGKQGATVKSIQEEASCLVRVLGSENLPVFALQHDRVIEVVGEPIAVHKALELIASHLRKFLVDRSIIPLFEMQMQRPNPPMERMPPPHHQSWGPSQGLPPNVGGVGPGFGHNLPYMPPPPRQHDHYYPPADIPPMEKQPHQGISAYGREAPMGVHASSNAQAAPSMVTQITQEMQIPLSYADAVIGTAGSSISYIRRASGATVAIQESRGIPGEMTVEISGTASQVQTAQQLVQNFMAEAAAAAAPTQAQTGGSTDQAYNPYAAHDSAYASLPSNQGPTGHSGGYGSAYGSNYGY